MTHKIVILNITILTFQSRDKKCDVQNRDMNCLTIKSRDIKCHDMT